jgi:hypothetical protein
VDVELTTSATPDILLLSVQLQMVANHFDVCTYPFRGDSSGERLPPQSNQLLYSSYFF